MKKRNRFPSIAGNKTQFQALEIIWVSQQNPENSHNTPKSSKKQVEGVSFFSDLQISEWWT